MTKLAPNWKRAACTRFTSHAAAIACRSIGLPRAVSSSDGGQREGEREREREKGRGEEGKTGRGRGEGKKRERTTEGGYEMGGTTCLTLLV